MSKHPWLLIFGVVLPAITWLVELSTGISGEVYLNPIPTWWHVLLVGSVPIANLIVLLGMSKQRSDYRLQFWANGFAIGISSIYAMAYLPISVFSLLAIVAWGIGLLPLSPLLAFFACVAMAAALHRSAFDGNPRTASRHFWMTSIAVVLGWFVFLCGDLPYVATRSNLDFAIADDEVVRERGLWWLRRLGSKAEMRRLCDRQKQDIRPSTWTYRAIANDEIREAYFRMTGESLDAQPVGRLSRRTAWGRFNDGALGGEAVAGFRDHLYLDESSLDLTLHPEELVAYTEWTLEFRNDNSGQEEARAQFLLPPDSVVSRLTLWVNGQPREAAFAATPKVQAAYQKVAVVQRCDPVLVTWKGKHRIFMQCFPVPPHGRMKVRVGVTSPMQLDAESPYCRLPQLIEQNFSNSSGMKHQFAARSADERPVAMTQLSRLESREQLPAFLSDPELSRAAVRFTKPIDLRQSPPHDAPDGEEVVRQSLELSPRVAPLERLCVIVDGSSSMRPHFPLLAEIIQGLDAELDVQLLLAADRVYDLSEWVQDRDQQDVQRELIRRLRLHAGNGGGMDNVPALVDACQRQRFAENAAMLWIHGPQPHELSPTTDLWRQLSELEAPFHDVQIEPGPNRVAEDFSTTKCQFAYFTDANVELRSYLQRLVAGGSRWRRTFDVQLVNSEVDSQANGKSPLIPLWADLEVGRLLRDDFEGNRDRAIEVAEAHHIVTPVTGAVVLESDQQFDDAGLTPVDAQAKAINTPEPSSATLGLIGLISFLLMSRRARRRG